MSGQKFEFIWLSYFVLCEFIYISCLVLILHWYNFAGTAFKGYYYLFLFDAIYYFIWYNLLGYYLLFYSDFLWHMVWELFCIFLADLFMILLIAYFTLLLFLSFIFFSWSLLVTIIFCTGIFSGYRKFCKLPPLLSLLLAINFPLSVLETVGNNSLIFGCFGKNWKGGG